MARCILLAVFYVLSVYVEIKREVGLYKFEKRRGRKNVGAWTLWGAWTLPL